MIYRAGKPEDFDGFSFDTLFMADEAFEIVDGRRYGVEYGQNANRLLLELKKNTKVISEKTQCARNDSNPRYSINNVYEHNGLIVTVTVSMPRSMKHKKYTFVCREAK